MTRTSRSLVPLTIAAVALLLGGFALAAFYAPMDADQGFMQKIFYLHVPLAICALAAFVWGGIQGALHLRRGAPIHDLRSYVSIHLGIVFGLGVLATGSIWAKASWGQWWVWEEPTLVGFLIVFLLYACYQPLRFSIEDREKQARYASVFAVTAGVFVPLNFAAIRAAESLVHPKTFDSADNLPGTMALAFFVSLAGMALLFVALYRYEVEQKQTRFRINALKRRLGGADEVVGGRSAQPVLELSQ
jgi:heme exporter protein C